MLPKVYLIGNLAQDPVFGVTNNGIEYARISVACSPIRSANNPSPQTHYFSMTVWRTTANYVKNNLGKGDGVFVEGKLMTRSYTNNNGQVVYTTEINVDLLQLTNRRSNNPNRQNYEAKSADYQTNNNFDYSVPVPAGGERIITKTKLDLKGSERLNELPSIEPNEGEEDDENYFNEIFDEK